MKTSNNKEAILIVLVAGIGDLILASKSIRAIRNGFPEADIHLLTNKDAARIANQYEYVDKVWSFPIRDLQHSKLSFFAILKLIRDLRKIDFHLAVNLYRICSWTGSLKMALIFSSLRARTKVGHDRFGFGFLLDKKVAADTFENQHFTDAMMDIALLAEGKPDNKGIEVYWDKESEGNWSHLFSPNGNDRKKLKIGINPGANEPHKRWDPDKYALVSDQLIEEYDSDIFILGGPGEQNIAQRIQDMMKYDSINLSGKLSLDDLIYIISQFDLLITNDSGPMHIAAAVDTPIVAIFGPEIPLHTKPYMTGESYRIVNKDIDCRPCSKNGCEQPACLQNILPENVLEECHEILKSLEKAFPSKFGLELPSKYSQ